MSTCESGKDGWTGSQNLIPGAVSTSHPPVLPEPQAQISGTFAAWRLADAGSQKNQAEDSPRHN